MNSLKYVKLNEDNYDKKTVIFDTFLVSKERFILSFTNKLKGFQRMWIFNFCNALVD